jgi:hypothetical protein
MLLSSSFYFEFIFSFYDDLELLKMQKEVKMYWIQNKYISKNLMNLKENADFTGFI